MYVCMYVCLLCLGMLIFWMWHVPAVLTGIHSSRTVVVSWPHQAAQVHVRVRGVRQIKKLNYG